MIRINRHSLALAGWAGFAMAPAPALAECAQWDMNGEWRFVQSNMSYGNSPVLTLQQNGNQIQGVATFILTYYTDDFIIGSTSTAHFRRVNGTVHGGINGNSVEFVVFWPGEDSIGVYTGEIGSHRLIEGSAYDQRHPEVTATWITDRPVGCRTGAGPAGEQTGTTSSALTTGPAPPPEPTVRAQRRIPRDPNAPPVPSRSICETAQIARARNSPAAPGLEAQCRAARELVDAIDPNAPQPIASRPQGEADNQSSPVNGTAATTQVGQAASQPFPIGTSEIVKAITAVTPEPEPVKAQGRVVIPGHVSPKLTICEAAKKARDRGSPATPGLTKQCLESGGTVPQ